EPRDVLDESPRETDLRLYCPPGDDLEQRGSRAAPRPDDEGLANATVPGTVIGPQVAEDPVLVPTGTEIAAYWAAMMEGLRDGGGEPPRFPRRHARPLRGGGPPATARPRRRPDPGGAPRGLRIPRLPGVAGPRG